MLFYFIYFLRKRLISFVAVSKRGLKSDASWTIEYLRALKELVPHSFIRWRDQQLLISWNDCLPLIHETSLMIQQHFATLNDIALQLTTCIIIN